jgi:PAB1-binding protein PBP1
MGAAAAADNTSRAPTPGTKPTVNKKGAIGSVTSNIHRERLLHLSLTLIGQKVVVTLTDGTVLEGVFHTFTPFDGVEADMKNKYVLTAVKVTKAEKGTKIENGSTAILAVEKVCSLYGKNINLDRPNQNGAKTAKGGEFVTDTQISAAKTVGGKDLVAAGSVWTTGGKQTRADALAGALGGPSAKDTSGLKGSIGKWDQFKANEELFNVNASFDENLYTTELDKTQIDARKIAEAERIAREIETTTSTNIHIAEERGHSVETDYDEEDRYSGVLTKDGKQRHEVVEKPVPAPKMNYAAAAAKADTAKKAASAATDAKPAQAAKEEAEKPEKARVEAEVKKEEKPAETPKEAVPAPDVKPEEEVKEDEDSKQEERKEEVKKTSKLNANAKEFTFNPSAKSFTPSFATGQPQLPPMDPNFHMHGGHPMQPPHYMPAQMGQPGTS